MTSARVALRCQGACWGRAFAGGGWLGCLGRAFCSTLIIRAGITLGGCAAELEAAATEPLGWTTFGLCEGFSTGCAWLGTCCAGACGGLGTSAEDIGWAPKYPVGTTCMPRTGCRFDTLRTLPLQISHDGLIMSWMTSFRTVLQNKFNNMPAYAMYHICVITSRMKFITHVWQIICNSRHNNFRNSYVL